MKNISVSNDLWKRLRHYRHELGFKHYTKLITFLLDFYEDATQQRKHTNLEEIKKTINKNELIVFKQLTKDGKEIFRGYGFPDFYHVENGRLIVDEVNGDAYSRLTKNQIRFQKHLIETGARYRIWNVDKLGKSKIVYDSDKRASLLEEKMCAKNKHANNNDEMWDI